MPTTPRRHLQLVLGLTILKFLRFQNVTEQIANAMIFNILKFLFLNLMFFKIICHILLLYS